MACGHEVPMKGIISARADWNVVSITVVSGIEIPMKGTLSRLRATHIATKSPSGDWNAIRLLLHRCGDPQGVATALFRDAEIDTV